MINIQSVVIQNCEMTNFALYLALSYGWNQEQNFYVLFSSAFRLKTCLGLNLLAFRLAVKWVTPLKVMTALYKVAGHQFPHHHDS